MHYSREKSQQLWREKSQQLQLKKKEKKKENAQEENAAVNKLDPNTHSLHSSYIHND